MRYAIAILISLLSLNLAWAHSENSQVSSWKIVPNKNVCMVTEAYFPKPQIPVKVGSKTYYGCCDNCKKTLTESKEARTAIDPYSKKSVDKSTATIAANDDGNVLYFENKESFEKYVKSNPKNEDHSSHTDHSAHSGH